MIDDESATFQTLSWPVTERFYLTLDFECDYGTALPENTYQAVEAVDDLQRLLDAHDVPLTCFVQTELLDAKPEAVETIRAASSTVQFHPHSHTHKPRGETIIEDEIRRSTVRYTEFFGRDPVGYRFPNGNVRQTDYRCLAEYGYEFDASVFPSWRPNHFNNTSKPTVPQYLPSHDLVEIPFTVYSDRLRIPTALSYGRLFRRPFEWLLTRRPPPVVVYNIHMHDLVTPDRFSDLPPTYKAIYGQNDRGFELLRRTLEAFDEHGYTFDTLDNLHETVRKTVPQATDAD